MAVRLGDIELTRLQVVEVDEGRNLVEHRLPGGAGSVFQDLGRGAIGLHLEGILLGEVALREIEALRTAHADATPLGFSGDIAVGSELTEVLIEDFQVHQVPGYQFRYHFSLRVREYTEPPEPAGAASAAVDEEVAADAESWNQEALALGGALDEPGGLAGLISGDGNLLSRINLGELAQAVVGAIGGLDPSDFAHLVSAITGVDPELLNDLFTALAEADSLEDLFSIMTGAGLDVLEQLTGIDLSAASDLVKAFVGGPEFLDKLDKVRKAAEALLAEVQAFDPLGAVRGLGQAPSLPGGGAP
jgi:hypothetical protein